MEVITGLQQAGFSEWEAKAYAALLNNPDITGYELSRFSGVPRAKIYETLENLQRKAAVLSRVVDGKNIYRAVPHRLLLSRRRADFERLCSELDDEFSSVLSAAPAEKALFTLTGWSRIAERAKEMCNSAKSRLLLSGFPEELRELALSIEAARARGVSIQSISFGSMGADDRTTKVHVGQPSEYLQAAVSGRWFTLIRDNEEVILAQVRQPERSTALWTENAVICWVLADWVTKNIQHNSLRETLELLKDESGIAKLREDLAEGEEISQWAPGDVPPLKPNPLWPSVDTIMERLAERFRARGDRPVLGVYRFELFGEGGGTYQFEVSPMSVSMTQHGYLQPDLLVQMSALDLRAMVVGDLHPAACHVKGRIKVSGDLNLAANLQWLLQPMTHVPRVEVEL